MADLTPWVISEYLDLNVFALPSKTRACPDNHCNHIAQKEMACRHFLFHIQCDYSSHDAKSVKCIFSFWKWSLTWLPSCCSKEGVPSESSFCLGKGRRALACRCCDCMRFSDREAAELQNTDFRKDSGAYPAGTFSWGSVHQYTKVHNS